MALCVTRVYLVSVKLPVSQLVSSFSVLTLLREDLTFYAVCLSVCLALLACFSYFKTLGYARFACLASSVFGLNSRISIASLPRARACVKIIWVHTFYTNGITLDTTTPHNNPKI